MPADTLRQFESDDADGVRLTVDVGGNGDYYLKVIEGKSRGHFGPAVRVCTSGSRNVKVLLAIAALYRALGEADDNLSIMDEEELEKAASQALNPDSMITVRLPSGGHATVSPNASPETIAALDRLVMAAVEQIENRHTKQRSKA